MPNKRYIDADKFEDRLRKLRVMLAAEGKEEAAESVRLAIQMLLSEPSFQRADLVTGRIFDPENLRQNQTSIACVKQHVFDAFIKNAVEYGYAEYHERKDAATGRSFLTLDATFLIPEQSKFMPTDAEKEKSNGY